MFTDRSGDKHIGQDRPRFQKFKFFELLLAMKDNICLLNVFVLFPLMRKTFPGIISSHLLRYCLTVVFYLYSSSSMTFSLFPSFQCYRHNFHLKGACLLICSPEYFQHVVYLVFIYPGISIMAFLGNKVFFCK